MTKTTLLLLLLTHMGEEGRGHGGEPEYANSIFNIKMRFQNLLESSNKLSRREKNKQWVQKNATQLCHKSKRNSWEAKGIDKGNEIVCGSLVKTLWIKLSS